MSYFDPVGQPLLPHVPLSGAGQKTTASHVAPRLTPITRLNPVYQRATERKNYEAFFFLGLFFKLGRGPTLSRLWRQATFNGYP